MPVPELDWPADLFRDATPASETPIMLSALRRFPPTRTALSARRQSDFAREWRKIVYEEHAHENLLINLLSEDHSRADDTDHHCMLLEP